ncbi:hypothetical protein [Glaciecola sp.]|uniref:hypothetical protein n=1 Tax=Glaciecola sp. MF2-115 TaxID=3384827 RepID=UPI00398A4671
MTVVKIKPIGIITVFKSDIIYLGGNIMLMGFLIVISFLVSSLYYYVEAVKNAMGKKRWLVGGMIMGPMLLPMFNISKTVQRRKATGFDSCYLRP